ncbi:tetratricopeptide repeat protein [Tunicatimonas pelagia]|uniref:tetratricopeptide repeat protein n=1 Tax=Tunicatimonas pelagia TaxID=931531 RepID=UPI0026659951|nr:tetratricopeptide repeat protein [Tunicatimonas pelagia]WKN43634.1 tetratricopeptide repeat protein [Tunicatimonas pelagia]
MSAEDHAKQGYQQLQQENYQQALEHFQRALAEEDTHPESLYGAARASFKLQRYEESIRTFDRLINLLPNNATYLSERGVALHWMGNNQLALEDFDRAAELEPENPYRYSSRAYIKDRLRDYQGAIDDYSRAIELDPEDAIAYNNRGLVEEKLGYIEKAKKSYQQADRLDQRSNGKADVTTERPTMEASENQKYIKSLSDQASSDPPEWRGYWSEIRAVFTSREQFRDFMQFVRNPFRKIQ